MDGNYELSRMRPPVGTQGSSKPPANKKSRDWSHERGSQFQLFLNFWNLIRYYSEAAATYNAKYTASINSVHAKVFQAQVICEGSKAKAVQESSTLISEATSPRKVWVVEQTLLQCQDAIWRPVVERISDSLDGGGDEQFLSHLKGLWDTLATATKAFTEGLTKEIG